MSDKCHHRCTISGSRSLPDVPGSSILPAILITDTLCSFSSKTHRKMAVPADNDSVELHKLHVLVWYLIKRQRRPGVEGS